MFGQGYALGSLVTFLGLLAAKKFKEICEYEDM